MVDVVFHDFSTRCEYLPDNSLPTAMDFRIHHTVIADAELPNFQPKELSFQFDIKLLRDSHLNSNTYRWWQVEKMYASVGQPMALLDGRVIWRWNMIYTTWMNGNTKVNVLSSSDEFREAVREYAVQFPFKIERHIMECKLIDAFDIWTTQSISHAEYMVRETQGRDLTQKDIATYTGHSFLEYIRTRR